ncbi:uncharacterized protein L201_005904 [Kwoniella dendrophila CBS 6074]|uniref:Uncharacterized protein n=1 Tax=Kwoniella dendrophila CBS 6074 TaxID=1295534 RepID=A0AAX4K099_9TREE
MSYLSETSLVNIAVTSSDTFEEAITILYDDILYGRYQELLRKCTTIKRLRQYVSAIRTIRTPVVRDTKPVELFAAFPNLRKIYVGKDCMQIIEYIPPSASTKGQSTFIRYSSLAIKPREVVQSLQTLMSPSRDLPLPEEWNVTEKLLRLDVSPLQPNLDLEEITHQGNVIVDTWRNGKGIFEIPIHKLLVYCAIPCEDLYERLIELRQNTKLAPSILAISVVQEDLERKEGPNIITLIENSAYLVERLMIKYTMSKISMDIHQFLQKDIRFPKDVDNTLKILEITLSLRSILPGIPLEHENLDLELGYTGPPISLASFRISLDCSPDKISQQVNGKERLVTYKPRIPPLSQITKGMLAIGGINCKYILGVYGCEDKEYRSEMLNEMFQMEMRELLKARKEPVRWRRLSPEERV